MDALAIATTFAVNNSINICSFSERIVVLEMPWIMNGNFFMSNKFFFLILMVLCVFQLFGKLLSSGCQKNNVEKLCFAALKI